jgi:hypothetical protein
VRASKDAGKLKGGYHGRGLGPDAGREAMKEIMKLVEGIAFYKRGDVWVQANLAKDAARKVVKQFSDEYFELLSMDRKVGLYLALGKVDFKLGDTVYSIR